MLRHERRLLIDCLGIGCALTLLIVAADAYGALQTFDDFLYDLRCRACQVFTPRPTDTLVHLDIDDPALEAIGWPMPRANVARILDEVRLAGPRAVEMDVLFTEPSRVEYVPRADPTSQPAMTSGAPAATTAPSTTPAVRPIDAAGAAATQPATQPAATGQPVEYTRIDHDAELAAAMARLGNVIVPAVFQPVPRYSPLVAAMVDELRQDAELDPEPLADRIRSRGRVRVPETGLGEQFFVARREAFNIRLRELNLGPETAFETVRRTLLPRTPVEIHTGAANVLEDQWHKYLAAREFRRFTWPRPSGMRPFDPTRVQLAPVRPVSAAASGGAFVDYTQFGSPVIRTLPMLLEADGHVYPQMALALACRMLDADVTRMRVENDELRIPRNTPGGPSGSTGGPPEIVIPLAPPAVSSNTGATYGHLLPIPWFGGRNWETMYDWPARQTSAQHVPMNQVWRAVLARNKIIRNNEQLDESLRAMFVTMDLARLRRYDAERPTPDDYATRMKWIAPALEDAKPYIEQYAAAKPEELDEVDRIFLNTIKTLQELGSKHGPELERELRDARAELASQLKGKAVLIGWTATASIADFVPTSLHEKCPGPVVHGVVYNGIMTGELWRVAPWWVSLVISGFLGAFVSLTTARLTPLKALAVALGLAGIFAALNGYVLFDYGNLIVPAAGPLITIVVVWAACTLTGVIIETAERNRITRRFRNYVDPKLVSYVLENPQVTFDGERREMTVVFTDLKGFTTMTERLGERVVPVLNELLGELVPIIRVHHSGLVNKFLGDGIMFFYNAPYHTRDHAADAVATVLDMHAKVAEFSAKLRARGLPELAMRAGVMTAEMIVGDAGGAGAADYTVLGDSVNTGARLEAANKFTGTSTLISARTAELLDGAFLVRPIGKLVVVGKDEAVLVYEPLARTSDATPRHRELARLTEQMFNAFVERRFHDAVGCADALDSAFGASRIAGIYRKLSREHLDDPPPDNFDGRIVLTEK